MFLKIERDDRSMWWAVSCDLYAIHLRQGHLCFLTYCLCWMIVIISLKKWRIFSICCTCSNPTENYTSSISRKLQYRTKVWGSFPSFYLIHSSNTNSNHFKKPNIFPLKTSQLKGRSLWTRAIQAHVEILCPIWDSLEPRAKCLIVIYFHLIARKLSIRPMVWKSSIDECSTIWLFIKIPNASDRIVAHSSYVA